jgi:HAD superfamily hydrolase (TIGR01509 family)
MSACSIGIGFDIDHTLCIDNRLERVAMLHLLDRIVDQGGRVLGSPAQEMEAIDVLLSEQREGIGNVDDAVRRFVTERGASDVETYVKAFRRIAVSMVDTFVVPDPYAKHVLQELAAEGIPLAVLSNGWNPLQHAKARRAGFEGNVLASAQLGVQKPRREAFEALSRELGLEPERCFYVGDDPKTDVAGAIGAGMQAVWLDIQQRTYPAGLPAPTHTVRALRDVPGLIRTAVGV